MNFSKNKNAILTLVALLVVCGGSFLGVKMMTKNVEPEPSQMPTYIVITTTQAPTTETVLSPSVDAFASTTSNLLTTFAMPTTIITTQPTTVTTTETTTETTTAPTTTEAVTLPTTTETTTTAAPTTAATTTTAKVTLPSSGGIDFSSSGLAGYLYDANGNFYFTSTDPWQRAIGYGEIYDTLAPFGIFYLDTMRCKFNYADKDWCIQFWKGQYGMIFVGMEIGVYTKDPSRDVDYYDCASDEDALYMSSTFYRNGEEIFSRDYAKYWWCTGFVPGRLEKMSDRSELLTKSRITMKDYNMLLCFVNALKENGLELDKDFKTKGLDVYVTW